MLSIHLILHFVEKGIMGNHKKKKKASFGGRGILGIFSI